MKTQFKIHFLTKLFVCFCIILIVSLSCREKNEPEVLQSTESVVIESGNGITYKLYKPAGNSYKGIIVVGSGNNENQPSEGSLDGAAENDLCKKASEEGYLAAVVKYRATPGNAEWNQSAEMIAVDFKNCIEAIAAKYGVDKTKSVAAGFSYATFMLFTAISFTTHLSFSKGVIGACGSASEWNAQNFKIPVYAINCAGNNEGDFNGEALYNKIPANSPIKGMSGGYTDNNCGTHCGGNWTSLMVQRLKLWIP